MTYHFHHQAPNACPAAIRQRHYGAAIIRKVGDEWIAFATASEALGHPSAQVWDIVEQRRAA